MMSEEDNVFRIVVMSTKYVMVDWPDIQQYMEHPDYPEYCYYDPKKDVWFIPETWEDWVEEAEIGGDIGDLEDALG